MATDVELIEQIQKGKREAYGQLFRKYYQQIYSICFSILKNQHDAEEVTNDTFFHAYMKLDQLRQPNKFFSWLKKSAQNRSKNYLRDKPEDSLPLASAQTADDGIEVIASTQDGTLIQRAPDEHLLSQELADAIMEAVEALPMQYREVVRARIDGLEHSEIGEQLNISAQASMNRLHRARKQLLAHLKDFLNAIFGLPKILSFKNIISGGILAMKIGTTAKVTLCIISVLIAGFVGFQIVTHNPDVESPKVVTQQQITRSEVKQIPVSKMDSRPSESKLSENKLEEFVAWLDSLEEATPMEEINEEDKMEEQQELGNEELTEELPDELKLKVERYAKLAKILPTFREVRDERFRIAKQSQKYIEEHYRRLRRQGGPYPPPDTREFEEANRELLAQLEDCHRQISDMFPELDVCPEENGHVYFRWGMLRPYFGKRLPWDGNPDYFAASLWP